LVALDAFEVLPSGGHAARGYQEGLNTHSLLSPTREKPNRLIHLTLFG
jgi:hypothetical protein